MDKSVRFAVDALVARLLAPPLPEDQILSNASNSIEDASESRMPAVNIPEVADILARTKKPKKADTAGPKWGNMPATERTPEVKRDLQMLKLQGLMDPSMRIRRNHTSTGKYFQIGTIVGNSSDFYSDRIVRKDRKQSFAEEVLADPKIRAYTKRRFDKIQTANAAGRKQKFKRRKKR
eukprot:gnl/Hemi2/11016_TR3779_c0_g1_i1.p1 gnl/Hemi2/11016_TR3779_c0_g1~~gnl/Hemi2/11016_TR3779_c0_g1_i1.p1  ORF type:complete len:178 (-),score=31.99 gnl/Hemi2/11016_TR3779_c0_g1_i1:104-637(-)